jgi:hypothetical protein
VVIVSSQKFADALPIAGNFLIADVHLFFHPALAAAMDTASRLPPLSQTVGRAVQTDRQPVSANALASPNVFTATDPTPATALEAIRLGTVPVDLLSASPMPLTPTTGTLGAARRLVAANVAAVDTPLVSVFNASRPRPQTYLEAICSPLVPQPALVRALKPLAPARGCFRCLASDHLVAKCGEPVRCKLCRAYGHKSP